MEFIFNSFPSGNKGDLPGAGESIDMVDNDGQLDPLFGLMGYSAMCFDDMPGTEGLLVDDPVP